jgi:hypothetical protein
LRHGITLALKSFGFGATRARLVQGGTLCRRHALPDDVFNGVNILAKHPRLVAPTFGEFLFPPELVRAIRRVGSVRAALR